MADETDSNYEEGQSRKFLFEKYRRRKTFDPDSLFGAPAIIFKEFNCDRITFRFWPYKVVEYVLPSISFLCKLRFDGKHWRIKRDSFPVNYKWRIYSLFWNKEFFIITDKKVLDVIVDIYNNLLEWSCNNSDWRRNKFQRFQDGDSDVSLNSEDEIMFLSEEQRTQRAIRREAIYKRMIPPPPEPEKKRKRMHHRKHK